MSLPVPRRVVRVCRAMALGCALGAVALPLTAARGVFDPVALMGVDYPAVGAPSAGWMVVAALVLAAPMAIVGRGLLFMVALFRDHGAGRVFTAANAGRIRAFGLCLVVGALVKPVAHTLAVLALTHGFEPGTRLLQITLGLGDATLVALGGGMAVLGWVMGEARRLAEDVEAIV